MSRRPTTESAISKMQTFASRWNSSLGARAAFAVICGSVLTFFACQIFLVSKMALQLRIGAVVVIAAIGIAGIWALLSPDEEDGPPAEKLYTADEVAALLAAVKSGKLVAADAATCKYCGKDGPEGTAPDGSHYHRACLQASLQRSAPKR
jgi:hypothetical protein